MRHRIDLGKSLGLGGVFFVAAAAEVGDVGQLGRVPTLGLDVFGLGTVAGLASYARVLSRVVHFGFGIMAEGALGMARVGDGQPTDHVKRARSIVPIFTKILGNHSGANNEEYAHSRQQNHGRTNQMSRISEEATQSHPQNRIGTLVRKCGRYSAPQASLRITWQYWVQTASGYS